METGIALWRSETYAGLARAFSQAEPGLEQEFTRLFLGPGRPVAHPFESVYREGRTMGQTTLDVRRCLAKEGLAPAGRTLPDHVGIELTFMAHLAAREARAWDDDREAGEAWRYLGLQGRFLQEHLAAWLPQFCHRVLAGRPHEHYARLARRAEAFVAQDVARLQGWLGHAGHGAAAAARQERWAVTVDQGCTLCGICIQVCRPQALHQLDNEKAVALAFNPDLCHGCAACQRWCPEGLIDVAQVPAGAWAAGGELVQSPRLACPRCGRFHVPAAMVAKVQAQVGPGHEALLQRFALCSDCKKADVPWSA